VQSVTLIFIILFIVAPGATAGTISYHGPPGKSDFTQTGESTDTQPVLEISKLTWKLGHDPVILIFEMLNSASNRNPRDASE
jgi:hypothetical protein